MYDLGSISPMFYDQLLRPKIPKAQKDTDDLTVFFALLGSACVKAVRRYVGEIYPFLAHTHFIMRI